MGNFLKKVKDFERMEKIERNWLKGGNEATSGSGITHSPTGEQNAANRAHQNDEVENLHGWRPSLGAVLVRLKSCFA